MPGIDKTLAVKTAIARIGDGATVMIGGFGVPGTPFWLIEELVRHGPRDLTIIKNDANEIGMGIDWLIQAGLVRTLITSHIGLNSNVVRLMNAGDITVEFVAQGILAERIRAAGAGLIGIVTDIGLGLALSEGKERVSVGEGDYIFEPALRADFALVHAERSDRMGNLVYRSSARNFNPLMAMAANHVIAEAEQVLDIGDIGPDEVHTAAPFVDVVIPLPELPEVYGIVQR